jgi:hypothetical protein
MESHCQMTKSDPLWDEKSDLMDSESVSPWQGTLAFQIFGRPAEHVPSAVTSRSAEADHCKDVWKDAR